MPACRVREADRSATFLSFYLRRPLSQANDSLAGVFILVRKSLRLSELQGIMTTRLEPIKKALGIYRHYLALLIQHPVVLAGLIAVSLLASMAKIMGCDGRISC